MKALVYHGPGRKAWEQVPDPVLQAATDVIVSGTDLSVTAENAPPRFR